MAGAFRKQTGHASYGMINAAPGHERARYLQPRGEILTSPWREP